MKDGTEAWILAHVEIQGYEDKEFALRMFQYYYRIKDKYGKPIVAFAILTDDNPNYKPTAYIDGFLGTKLTYEYHSLKLSDYRPEDFQKTDNLFAFALEVAWYGLKANKPKAGESLFELKMNLFRRIQRKGYNPHDFRQILKFIKNYVSFANSDLTLKFEEQINKPIKSMGIIETVETYYKQYGVREGKKLGRIEGRKEGHKEGREEGEGLGVEKERRNTIIKFHNHNFEVKQIANILEIQEEEVLKVLKDKSLL